MLCEMWTTKVCTKVLVLCIRPNISSYPGLYLCTGALSSRSASNGDTRVLMCCFSSCGCSCRPLFLTCTHTHTHRTLNRMTSRNSSVTVSGRTARRGMSYSCTLSRSGSQNKCLKSSPCNVREALLFALPRPSHSPFPRSCLVDIPGFRRSALLAILQPYLWYRQQYYEAEKTYLLAFYSDLKLQASSSLQDSILSSEAGLPLLRECLVESISRCGQFTNYLELCDVRQAISVSVYVELFSVCFCCISSIMWFRY